MIRIEIRGRNTQELVKLNSVFKVQKEKDGSLSVYVWCYDPKKRDIRLKKAMRGDTLLLYNHSRNFAYGIEHGDSDKIDESIKEQSGLSLGDAIRNLEAIESHVFEDTPLKVNGFGIRCLYYDDIDDVVRVELTK